MWKIEGPTFPSFWIMRLPATQEAHVMQQHLSWALSSQETGAAH
jgi:hypothetical protein